MGFGVFIHRSDSIYDDSPAERYQFPKQYLGRVEECVGDWILYYEPRKVPNTRGYFATAKVQEIVPDPAPGMHIALIEPGSYLDFPDPVPFMGIDGIAERGVLNEAGQISGRAQSAVRPISPRDFNRIIELGLARGDPLLPRVDVSSLGFSQEQEPFIFEQTRDRAITRRARPLVPTPRPASLRATVCNHGAEAHQRRWPGRGRGRSHPAS
jgi:putative restriction endonuclease